MPVSSTGFSAEVDWPSRSFVNSGQADGLSEEGEGCRESGNGFPPGACGNDTCKWSLDSVMGFTVGRTTVEILRKLWTG